MYARDRRTVGLKAALDLSHSFAERECGRGGITLSARAAP